MTLRADSYGSTGEVKAFTRHLLDGQTAFNSTTRPTATELEKFIDRASGVLNLSAAQVGFTSAALHANSTAKLACDDWVTAQAAMYVEITQRGTGYGDGEGSRTYYFKGLYGRAEEFCKENKLGFQRLGVSQAYKLSDGLQFTGLAAPENRSDPTDSSLAQPNFTRNQFEFPKSNTENGAQNEFPDL
jgi:hypothetical protein